VRRHAKASSAGSTFGRGTGRTRCVLLAVVGAAFLLLPASPAAAEIIFKLEGSGAGTVSSNPAGIQCSNVGGGPAGPSCAHQFPALDPDTSEPAPITFTATPAAGSYLAGWQSDDSNGGFYGPTCNEGAANPCGTVDFGEFGFPVVEITATFEVIPDPPVVNTGVAAPGANDLLVELAGAVNPGGAEVTDCRFEYGLSTDYDSTLPCDPDAAGIGNGSADVPVSAVAELEQLKPNTTYHYRLAAANVGGTGRGADQTFTSGPAPADSCPNAGIRAGQPLSVTFLPECMGLEMVTPPLKGNHDASKPQVSADGGRVIFRSLATLGGTPGVLNYSGDLYVASRGASGWSTQGTTPPPPLTRGWDLTAQARSFTPDFSRWLQLAADEAQNETGRGQAFQAGLGGFFSPLSPPLVLQGLADLNIAIPEAVERSGLEGASADHAVLYFRPGPNGTGTDPNTTHYLPDDPLPRGSGADWNVYVTQLDPGGNPSLQLLARDRFGKAWGADCGTRLGGVGEGNSSTPAANGNRNQGAVSADGSHAYFSTRPSQPTSGECSTANPMRILERTETPAGPEISDLIESECDRVSPACDTTDGDDLYQGASVDQTKVYFTTSRQLADTDLDTGTGCNREVAKPGCDLYLYDSTKPQGERLTQVSAGEGPTPGDGANLYNGVTAISSDGSHVYFVAQGVLSGPNAEGKSPAESERNLYLWDEGSGETAFVGALDAEDGLPTTTLGLWGSAGGTFRNAAYPAPATGRDPGGAEVGGDGHVLLFESKAPLTSDDTDGTSRDVFRYDAEAEALERVSVATPGGEDGGTFDTSHDGNSVNFATLGTDFAEQDRWVSEDGQTALFTTAEGLVPGDANGLLDTYLWRGGQIYRLPGTTDTGRLQDRPRLSHDGSTVAFTSFKQLLPADGDSATDTYVLRLGGGYPVLVPPAPCQGEACQEPFSAQPPPTTASSEAVTAGNVKSRGKAPSGCPKGKRKVRRKGKVRCAKPQHKRKSQSHAGRAHREQGGQK
jgi:hypothetical protein